jgi:hypothetical protein
MVIINQAGKKAFMIHMNVQTQFGLVFLSWNSFIRIAETCTVNVSCFVVNRSAFYDDHGPASHSVLFEQALPAKHPFPVMGRHINRVVTDKPSILSLFEENTFSPRTARRHVAAVSGPTLVETLQSFQAAQFISFNDKLEHGTVLLGRKIATLTVVEPWVEQVIRLADYIELDASFHAGYPYVYTVPQAIYHNDPYPLGFTFCPFESSRMYGLFYEKLQSVVHPDIFDRILHLPVLSDEGTGLKSFCRENQIPQFFCFRHLINKFGAGSLIATLVRKMLFISTKERYVEQLPENLGLASSLFRGDPIHLRAFEELFLVTFEPHSNQRFDTWSPQDPTYDAQALWTRMALHVGTCSNHAERFHRTLKSFVEKCDSMDSKFLNVQHNVVGRVVRLSQPGSSRFMLTEKIRANRHFWHENYAQIPQIKYSDTCPTCHWSPVLEARYYYKVPCIHQQEDYLRTGAFKAIQGHVPIDMSYTPTAPIVEEEKDVEWDFVIRQKKRPKPPKEGLSEPPDVVGLEGIHPTPAMRELARDTQHIWGHRILPKLAHVLQEFWDNIEVSEKGKEPRVLTDLQVWTDFVFLVWNGAKTHQMKNIGYSKAAVESFMKEPPNDMPTKIAAHLPKEAASLKLT